MDLDAAAFVLDRVDVAREALAEISQILDKFDQPQDAETKRLVDELETRIEQLDAEIRAGSYPAP